jgi:hypothetical protein
MATMIDIADYLLWTDEEAVRRKCEVVVGKARGAGGQPTLFTRAILGYFGL